MGHGADLGTELDADRRLIELAADRCEAEPDPARRRALVAQFADAVGQHVRLTSKCLAGALREYVPGGVELSRHTERVRDQVDWTLGRVAEQNGRGGAGGELVRTLALQTRGLLDEERKRLLPALEQAVTWHVLEDLGEKVRAGRH
ncbi:hypothetical protein KGA66_00160 [Actinocrinis puniceicyclus]|uniref:Hemerythrin-like domain-containing protein n=1 Tax=Actinocrinis puniceicyclus TaxID=977794 RepID=A0A8J7WFY2_9ACTN|nr:hypothetical protein [Actinocrinis puniceicyclus]MBS2961436.1 hypothetical protein [Actinocrinis puniceicyclus]